MGDLERLRTHGIDPLAFGEMLTPSGLVLNEDIKWITFLGAQELSVEHEMGQRLLRAGSLDGQPWVTFCGLYDFAFLLRLLTSKTLPETLPDLNEDLNLFFPNRVDLSKLLGRIPNGDRLMEKKP